MRWRRRSMMLCLLISFVLVAGPAYAHPGARLVNGIKGGTIWIIKGTYRLTEYLVVETFRPVTAITHGLTNIFGVPVEI